MVEVLFWTALAATGAATAGLWTSALFAWGLLRPSARRLAGFSSPLTMIKPIKGLDDELDANLESIVASDPEGRLQIVIAIESADDPAWPAARAFADRHPGRDIEVLRAGPSGDRMGKT